MAYSRSYLRIGLVLTAVVAAPGLQTDRSGLLGQLASVAVAQEATTYLDELLTRARELLHGQWANPELAVGILEELIEAGSVEAIFELVGYYVESPENIANIERAKDLLDNLIATNPDVAARAWSVMAELYLANGPLRAVEQARDAYREAAALGDTGAMISLAAMMANPEEGAPDPEGAIELLSDAAATGDANAGRAWYSLATLHAETDDPARALEAFRRSADLGNSSAMVQLASMIANGQGGAETDLAEAEDLLNRALAVEPANAAWVWGVMAEVDILAEDPAKAVRSYQNAVALDNSWAMISLAGMLATGEGVGAPNPEEAIALLLRATEVGDQNAGRAWIALAELYRAEGDLDNAADAYRRAAELGSTVAMINYATILGTPDTSRTDFEVANRFLAQAIAAGDDNAAWAWSVLAGIRVAEEDPAGARDAYMRGAELGDTSAMINLALMLADGEQEEAANAIALLEQAAAAGDRNEARAWDALARLHRSAGNMEDAAEAFSRAAELGNSASMIDLAALVGLGDGIGDGPDAVKALALIDQAIAAEDENAAWAWNVAAELYLSESDVSDAAKGREAYSNAAAFGDTGAMINLAAMVATGEGAGDPDVPAAIALLTEAAAVNDANTPRAWNDLALLHSQTGNQDLALEYFNLLAATGDGFAHLSAAEIISTRLHSPAARQELVAHFRAAAELLGSRNVAQAMLRINTVALYAAVQALLVEAGYRPGSVDGVFGPRTEEALAEFCADRQLAGCLPSVVTTGLLTELLNPEAATSG